MKKKKIIKLIILLIILILVIIGGIFLFRYINLNKNITKFGNINAQELQEKIIKHLEESPININDETCKTEFRLLDPTKSKFDKNLDLSKQVANSFAVKNEKEEFTAYQEEFICAFIISKENDEIGYAIPCFKIESDNKGNVKSIEYIEMNSTTCTILSRIVQVEIQEALKEYGIDSDLIWNLKYKHNEKIKFNFDGKIQANSVGNEEFILKTFKTIADNMGNKYGSYSFNGHLPKIEDDMLHTYRYKIEFGKENIVINK